MESKLLPILAMVPLVTLVVTAYLEMDGENFWEKVIAIAALVYLFLWGASKL